MVRIENPKPGKRNEISQQAAWEMISRGDAVATARANDVLLMIRLTGKKVNTAAEYDNVGGTFYGTRIPIVNEKKMIREERSPRKWSFTVAVSHRERQNQHNNAEYVKRAAPSGPVSSAPISTAH